jgi:hypothetical protein
LLSLSLACSSALALCCCLHSWYGNFLVVFPKVPGLCHALTLTGHDIWHLLKWVLVFVLCRRCISEFSPALHIIFHIQIEEKKDKTQLKFSKHYVSKIH